MLIRAATTDDDLTHLGRTPPAPDAEVPDAAAPAEDLPPDPEAYDAPRATQARARGLAAPYIAGGVDPDIEATHRRERRYVRLLIAMIVVLILSGFVLGILENLIRGAG
jgi:hypothetical protein